VASCKADGICDINSRSKDYFNKALYFFYKERITFLKFKEELEQRLFQLSKGHHMFENKPIV